MIPVARAARVALLICIACGVVRAQPKPDKPDTIALLPLDAEPRLEAFGQPLAAEIGRVLRTDKLDVVVVGPKMAVPTTARLIIAGSLAAKGDAVVLQIRVRNPVDGTVLDTLEEIAANLVAIEKASQRLAARLLPVVRSRLAALHEDKPPPDRDPDHRRPAPAALPAVLVAVGVLDTAPTTVEPLRAALAQATTAWVVANRRTATAVEASLLGKKLAPETVKRAVAERGLMLEVLDYTIDPVPVPLARARIRARIIEPAGIVFDRVIATDTIVGKRQMTAEVLAERVAREALTILRPHMKRVEPTWR